MSSLCPAQYYTTRRSVRKSLFSSSSLAPTAEGQSSTKLPSFSQSISPPSAGIAEVTHRAILLAPKILNTACRPTRMTPNDSSRAFHPTRALLSLEHRLVSLLRSSYWLSIPMRGLAYFARAARLLGSPRRISGASTRPH